MADVTQTVILGDVIGKMADGFMRGVSPLERLGQNIQMMPVAGAEGRSIHGLNRWILITENRQDPRWFTKEQAEHLGAHLRDDEIGKKLVYWSYYETKDGQRIKRKNPQLKVFTVFNAEQFDGLPLLPAKPEVKANIEAVREVLKNADVSFSPTDKPIAYYAPAEDVIYAPDMTQYESREARLTDVLGEVIRRQVLIQSGMQSAPKGSQESHKETFIQSLATFIVANEFGLPYDDKKDRAYYKDWANLLLEHPTVFLAISAQAEKIAKTVIELSQFKHLTNEAIKMPEDWNGQFVIKALPDGGVELKACCYGGREDFLGSFDDRASAEQMQWQLNVLYATNVPVRRDYLVVPWQDRQMVRAAGAKFDPAAKAWYVPETLSDAQKEKLAQWRPKAYKDRLKMMAQETAVKAKKSKMSERIILQVPFTQRKQVKASGAQYDPDNKQWFVSIRGPLEGVKRWLPEKFKELAKPYCPEGSLKQRKRLYVSYEDAMLAKSRGAIWDPKEKSWYAPEGSFEKDFERWTTAPVMADPKAEFLSALIECGFDPEKNEPVQMDGQKHRFMTTDDKPGHFSGEYKGFLDARPAGSIRNFKTGEYRTWVSQKSDHKVTAEELAELKAQAALLKEKRARELVEQQESVAQRALHILEAITSESTDRSLTAYEARKGLALNGKKPQVGFADKNGNLVLPVTDATGKLWSLQYINEDGTKKFLKGGRKSGCFSVVYGENSRFKHLSQTETLIVCEGYATAMSVSQAVGQPVIVAFDAGNLKSVCQALNGAYPDKRILIAGDDDHHRELKGEANPGRQKAMAVCEDETLAGRVSTVFPTFVADEQDAHKWTDFNDLAQSSLGLEAVQLQIKSALQRIQGQHQEESENVSEQVRSTHKTI